MPAKKDDRGETKPVDQAQEEVANVSNPLGTPAETPVAPVVKDQIQLKGQPATNLDFPPRGTGTGGDGWGQSMPIRTIDTNTTMRRTATEVTNDLPLWVVIRKASEAISFDNYSQFIDIIFGPNPNSNGGGSLAGLAGRMKRSP